MNNSTPLLSIVIPTKNRYYYLKILVETLLLENFDEFEIIIQDNSDSNSKIVDFIESYKSDNRLKYNYTSGWLSVIENCDLGVKAATGEFVCMLGDDDGILIGHALNLVKYLIKIDIPAATINKFSYSWPDVKHKVWKEISGKLIIPKFKFNYKTLRSSDELAVIKKQGGAFGLGKLPRVYHAFVKRTVLNYLKNDTGSYFPGPSPDMANAVGICKYIDTYLYADFPIIISGHGKKSTGGLGSNKLHHGKIENLTHLPKDTVSLWSKKVPFFWSGPTIYSESARLALLVTEKTDSLNYAHLYACCLVYEKLYKNEINKTINIQNDIPFLRLKVSFYFILITFKRYLNFLKNIFKYKFMRNKSIQMNDISTVIKYLNKLY